MAQPASTYTPARYTTEAGRAVLSWYPWGTDAVVVRTDSDAHVKVHPPKRPGKLAAAMGVPSVVRDPERLVAVRRLGLLDAPAKASFDRLTGLAAELLDAPIALLTLIDRDRQFFVSSAGLAEPLRSARQTPLEYSMCQHAVALGRPLVCADARQDPELSKVKAVTEFGIVAYAGVPLISEGHPVGTLCVLDTDVRHWRPDEIGTLQRLADIAADEIKLHLLENQANRRREWTGVDRWSGTLW